MDYSYSVDDVDFGLQNAHGLLLTVSGSCITDYTWYNGTTVGVDITTDIYNLFGSTVNQTYVSTADGGAPIATCNWLQFPSLHIPFILCNLTEVRTTKHLS